ncbi:spore germination protein [Mesobacillus maritimus]|uniref:spore germination protein n=1 Tax=Mesobacillus maritimus TaxID=1643336 RepID=UPI0020407FB2|nr:spore germination protein [Mesobacillus maritimus]MCM3670312.1 spore germination protein [Mesobacillus maritimus]
MNNFFKKKKRWLQKSERSVEKQEQEIKKSLDYSKTHFINQKNNKTFTLTFIQTLVDDKIVNNNMLPPLIEEEIASVKEVEKRLPMSDIFVSKDKNEIENKLFHGYVMVTFDDSPEEFAFIGAAKNIGRSVTSPEIEFSVVGPKEAFIESLDQNINMIRKRLPIKELIAEEFKIGELTKTKVCLLYIDGVTNKQIINTVQQRLSEIDKDEISDSSYLTQIISDNGNSPFPQLLDSERPDRIVASLSEGKVAIIVDGSPHVLIGPTQLTEFFNSFEDYFLNWILASFIRLIRLFAVTFSIMITPIYVAVVTYHYELIPKDLLSTLIISRRVIPFPPILEALFLEVTIELLREAGARLPTKVGQTIGIVGGIVLGTASVEAGLTSNVLLIFIALSALASFTTPVYQMSNTIRILRFPFLFMAELWGLLGITIAFGFLLTHLLRLTSLGQPFMEPIFPFRVKDYKDALFRFPFNMQAKRPIFLRTEKPQRFSEEKAKKKKDIDE